MNPKVYCLLLLSGFGASACGSMEVPPAPQPEMDELTTYGDITSPVPDGWVLHRKKGVYCVYLPPSFEEGPKQDKKTPLRQLIGEEGVVTLDYNIHSAGKHHERNASVAGTPVTIKSTTPIPGFDGYFGAEMVHTMYWEVLDRDKDPSNNFYFDIVIYSKVKNHFLWAQKIFGTARVGKACP